MKTQTRPPFTHEPLRASFRALVCGLILSLPLGLRSESAGVPAPSAPTAPQQLLPNGDCETATQEADWPDHWSRPTAGSSSWDEEEGRRYLRLNVTEPGQLVLSYRSVSLSPEVKAVQVKLRARVIGLKCGPQAWFDARMMADFKTREGQKVRGAKPITFRKDTNGWVERTVRFPVPESATVLELMPALFQAYSGTFDIDELIVTPIDPAELTAAAASSGI